MSNNAKQLSAKRIRTRNNVIVYIVLSILAVIWLFPVAWVVMTSFRAEKGSYVSTFFPKSFTLDNYIKLFTDTSLLNFPQMFMNTLFIAICSCILSSFFLLSASFCLSRLKFKLRKPYMNMAMILGLFPGFTRWQIFTKITLPLSKPIVIYTILTSFTAPWVDFIFAKVICRANADQYTVAIGLWRMLEKEYIDSWYTSFAAGAVLISIPIAILFLKLQKYYVNGMAGAVKG